MKNVIKALSKSVLTLSGLTTAPANIPLDGEVLNVLKASFVFNHRNVFKTSSRRLHQGEYICLTHTSSRHLQDIFKTSSRRLQDVLQRCIQDVFKTYHLVKMFLVTQFQDVFETFSFLGRTAKTIIYRRFVYNQFHNILGLFDVLPNFLCTASETICDYYS